LNIILPIIDNIRYVQSLKEIAIEIPSQTAISKGTNKIFLIKSHGIIKYLIPVSDRDG
jgi:hypothetical protein